MYLNEDGVKQLPIELRRLITSFKRTDKQVRQEDGSFKTEPTFELKFVSKEKAGEMLNKHRGFYKEDNSQRPTVAIPSEFMFTDADGNDPIQNS